MFSKYPKNGTLEDLVKSIAKINSYDIQLCVDNCKIKVSDICVNSARSVVTIMSGNVLITPNTRKLLLFSKLARDYVNEDPNSDTKVTIIVKTNFPYHCSDILRGASLVALTDDLRLLRIDYVKDSKSTMYAVMNYNSVMTYMPERVMYELLEEAKTNVYYN